MTKSCKDFVVGIKQTLKSLNENRVKKCYIARNAECEKIKIIVEMCNKNNILIEYTDTMNELGKMFNISIGASCAALIK